MSLQSDIQAEVQHYQQLLAQGVQARDAYSQAFPNGLPTAQQVQEAQGSQQQTNAISQIGGLLAGALGVKAASNWMDGKPVLGSKITNALSGGSSVDPSLTPEVADPAYDAAIKAGGYLGDTSGTGGGAAADAASGGGGAAEDAGASTLGTAAGYAGLAGMAYTLGNNAYNNDGGKQILQGGGKSKDYLDVGLDSNPVTGWINPIGNALGLGSVGDAIFGDQPTTQQRQQNDDSALMNDPNQTAYQSYLKAQQPNGGVNGSGGPNNLGALDPSVAADFVGQNSQGQWVNNKFAQSRNEADLTPKDVEGADANFSLLGNSYLQNASQAQREEYQQALLDKGLWDEHQGQLSITDPTQAQQIWSSIITPPKDSGQQSTPPFGATLAASLQ